MAIEALDPRDDHRPTATGPIRLQRLDAAGLRTIPEAEWARLSTNALVENPFHARQYVMAGLDTIDRAAGIGGYAAWRGDMLVGLFLTSRSGRVPAPFPVANAAANLYQFNSTPLVDRDHAEAAVGAWLDALGRKGMPSTWAFTDIDLQSPLTRLIVDAARARGMATATANPYRRAHMTRTLSSIEEHNDKVLSKNRLKDVRRTMRRLGEMGTLTYERVSGPADFGQRLEDFLALEASGWKGAAGTAMLSKPDDAAFARKAFAPSPDGFSVIETLLLDGRPIAMELHISTGSAGFSPKIAYDETLRKLGPGMALQYLLIENLYAGKGFEEIDSAATTIVHSGLDFFDSTKSMAVFIVGTSHHRVRLLAWLHEERERMKHRVKDVIEKVKSLRRRPEPAPTAD